jgi:cytochrome b
MKQEEKKLNQTKVNLAVDAGIFVGFLVAAAPHFTGMTIHEWLGIAFAAGIITHLLLHWQWIVAISQRFLSNIPRQARLNYILNTLLFIDITLIIFSGLMISQVALPSMGLSLGAGGAWKGIHVFAANLSLVLIGLHVALHWQWIVNAIKRYVIEPWSAGHRAPQPRLVTNFSRKEL